METAVKFPMISVTVQREPIEVATMSGTLSPDEKWRFVDGHGHGHFWAGEDLPTLRWVVTGTDWIGDEFDASEIDVGEYRCTICEEVVVPKRRVSYDPVHLAGLTTIVLEINGEEFRLTEEMYSEAVAHWVDLLRLMV